MQNKEVNKHTRVIRINRLKGRVARVPCSTKSTKRILFVYGSHASIERNFGIAKALSRYGNVTFPDLPGFGGMDSFYSQNMEPDLDNLADYLAAFIRLEYGQRKKFSVCGFSFGFLVVLRMLDKYPEIAKRLELCISLSGITSADEFIFGEDRKKWQLFGSRVLSRRIPSTVYRYTVLSKPWIHATYSRSRLGKAKFIGMDKIQKRQALRQEVVLWQKNDVRTWAKTITEMLTVHNIDTSVDARLWHMRIRGDQYLDGDKVLTNMKNIFKSVRTYTLESDIHSPVMIDTEEKGRDMLPKKLQRDLATFAK